MGEGMNFPMLSLTAARVNANLTQKQFAERCGVSESTVIAWESGRRLPGYKMLGTIERVLGISLNFIRFEAVDQN